MTEQEIDNMKYKICCPLCDNKKCVRNTDACEAEQWKKNKLNDATDICVGNCEVNELKPN